MLCRWVRTVLVDSDSSEAICLYTLPVAR
ncbi:MAG: hypothetical protein QOJ97_941, partial [Solirubrobacteraceae bacterium]|nr:hypothetical protein [Solirubrobacteraceae bacterium]